MLEIKRHHSDTSSDSAFRFSSVKSRLPAEADHSLEE